MIPLFEVSGSPYEMGKQIGAQAQKLIRAGAEFYQKNWETINGGPFESQLALVQPAMPIAKASAPKSFDELRGISEGSGVSLPTLFLINSLETVGTFNNYERCTTVLVHPSKSATASTLLAHNEDWISCDRNLVYALRAKPEGEPAFLGFTYGAWMPQYGLNEAGLAFIADSNTATDRHLGVSQTFVSREILRCPSVDEAVRHVRALPRADGHTYILASATEGVMLETTAARDAALLISVETPWRVHTNYYQSKELEAFEREEHPNSTYRYGRVSELLAAKDGPLGKGDLAAALSDHANAPSSVCSHTDEHVKEETIARLIIDPAARTMEVSAYRSCESKPERFSI